MAVKKIDPLSSSGSPEKIKGFVEELKNQWMATVDAISDPLMVVDEKYKIIKLNKALAKVSGKPLKSLIGKNCYKVFASRTKPCTHCSVAQVFLDGKSVNFGLDKAKPSKLYEVSAQPLLSNEGVIEGVLTIYRDQTAAKELQNQLIQTEKLASVGLLAGGIAHEINNPLGGILIFSQMMLKEMEADNPHYRDVVEIEAAALRCKDIIHNLLDFSRSESLQEIEQGGVPVDVIEAVLTALNFALIGSNRREVSVNKNFLVEDFICHANFNRLVQVFLNIIQNALQAMPRGGALTLSSREVEKSGLCYIAFEIEDDGEGIPASQLTKVFDPFYTTKDPGEGTGLGLSISYRIIADLKGHIEVTSSPNESTKFSVLLPVKQPPSRASQISKKKE